MTMTGREIFQKYSKIFDILWGIYKYLPKFIRLTLILVLNFGKIGFVIRYFELKSNALNIGNNIYIAKNIVIKNSYNLTIGNNNSLHEFCYIDAAGSIKIGDNVSIAHNCSLVSFEHTWENINIPIKYNPTKLLPIVIGSDVWLGCGVRILAGTVIEDRVIVAAGAVVKGKLESGYIYGGIPAKKLRKI